MSGKKKQKALIVIGIFLFIIIVLPLIAVGTSFIGRIAPDSVIPDSFDLYASVPNPVRLFGRILDHEPLPEIIALAELENLSPLLNQLKDSALADNSFVRFAARGRLDAAFLSGGRVLAAWDAGILSPLLKFLPVLAGRVTIPGLYYVKAGKNSRFEYRQEDGTVFFIGPYRNLLVISNNSALYESVISGTSRDGDRFGSGAKKFYTRDYDIAFLLSPSALSSAMGGGALEGGGSSATEQGQEDLLSALSLLQFPGPVEASLSILPNQLKINLTTPLGTNSPALQKIIERNSQSTALEAMIPAGAQYLTLLSAGGLRELLSAASVISAGTSQGAEFENAVKKADSSARMALGMNLEELLYSWTGSQFAIYGLEGRPNPVIALEIRDEKKRKEVFDKVFKSIFVNENIQLTLDGNRIPRIELPPFLNSFLQLLDIHVPSPYYAVQNNCLFISESAETLLAAVNSVRRNDVLPKTELWRALSRDNSGPSSFNIFYSLDRSLPFFLKGSGAAMAVLKSYRQGLARLNLENSILSVSLSVIPGAGKGIVPAGGFPLDLSGQGSAGANQGRVGNRLYRISSGKDTRLLLTRGADALAINPLDKTIRESRLGGTNLYAIPADGSGSSDGAVWMINSQGQVSLANKDLENLRGFPISTGLALSSPPAVWEGKLFLSGEDGSVHTVDSKASVSRWGATFPSALRSPLSFIDFKGKTYAAAYPKSFIFGELYLLDLGGNPLQNWPVPVSGIAFGSPLLFNAQYPNKSDSLYMAFITQAGELAVYTENAETLPGFPLELEGVFYLQPVFDGEYLWIIESEGTLYRIGLDGEIFSQKVPRVTVREEGYITVADISGGKTDPKIPRGEIFFSGEGNALYGYSRNFNSLEGFPLPVWGRPVFADLNGDGKIEAAALGMDNRLYMWQFR